MNAKTVYDLSMATGLLLISGGVGLVSVPAALVTAGALMIAITVFNVLMMTRRP